MLSKLNVLQWIFKQGALARQIRFKMLFFANVGAIAGGIMGFALGSTIGSGDYRSRTAGITAVSSGNRRIGIWIKLDSRIKQSGRAHQLAAVDPCHSCWIVK